MEPSAAAVSCSLRIIYTKAARNTQKPREQFDLSPYLRCTEFSALDGHGNASVILLPELRSARVWCGRSAGMRFLTVVAGSPLLCIIAFAASSGSRAQEQQVPAYGTAEVGATHDRTSLPDTPKPQGNYPPLPLPPRRLSFHERVNVYYHSVTSAETVAGPAFGAGITIVNSRTLEVHPAPQPPPPEGRGSAHRNFTLTIS